MNKTPVEWLGAGLLLASSLAAAGQGETAGTTPHEGHPQTSSTTPDPALLEFLGEWETSDGKWFDPTRLADTKTKAKEPRHPSPKKEDQSHE